MIDFEYLLAQRTEAHLCGTEKGRADEDFRSTILAAFPSAANLSRRLLFRWWLESQRDAAQQALPGEHWKFAWQMLVVLSVATGAGIGGTVTASLLLYRGDVPVNVLWFLACTVGVQLVILAIALALWLLRRTTGLLDDFRPLRSLIDGLVWAASSGLRKLPGEQRDRVKAILTRLRRRRDIYGALATWPFVAITQIFGVCFNVGIIVVFLVQISVKDIDFGWQSSFLQSDEAMFRLASGMATPWKSFAPEPHPTETQVAESHFEYKKERSNKSWWPFLCYSVCCYGLLVRAAFLLFVLTKWRQTLSGLKFDHEGCPTLHRQLIGPAVRAAVDRDADAGEAPDAATHRTLPRSGEAFAIVAAQVAISAEAITRQVRDSFGWTVAEHREAQVDYPGGNATLLSALAEKASELVGVVVVVPAERAPVKAISLFLSKVSAATAATPAEIILLLLGRVEGASFRPVGEENFKHWREFLKINNPQVSLETWDAK